MAHFVAYNTSDSTTGSTPLAGGASITPITIQSQQYGSLTYSCYSDVSGTLYIAQSFDGVNYDSSTSIAVAGGAQTATGIYPGVGGQVSVYAPFVQVYYVNGASPQTVMRLFVRVFGTKTG